MDRWPETPAPWGLPGPYPLGTPPWPAGPTAAWAPPPPPRKMRLGWVWVLLAIVAFLGVMFVTSIVVFVHAVEPPVDAMNHFLAAVDHRDYATAYALLCRDEQRTTSRDEFPTAIAPFANDLSEYDVYSFDPIGHDRSVQYTVKRVDGHKRTYRATMVREDGAWRVCDFFDERS